MSNAYEKTVTVNAKEQLIAGFRKAAIAICEKIFEINKKKFNNVYTNADFDTVNGQMTGIAFCMEYFKKMSDSEFASFIDWEDEE